MSETTIVKPFMVRYRNMERIIGSTVTRATDTLSTLRITIMLGLYMIGASAVSYFALMHQSLRLDESQSLWQSSHTIPGVLHTVALDVHVPLYHLVVHMWILYFGNDIMAVRLLSLFFFLITIPVVYLLSRYLLSQRWSLFATFLFSFSPFLLWYSSEARMYTMLLFVSALNQLFFIKILKNQKGWLGYVLTALVGIYTHYFFLFGLAAQAIYFLLNRRQFPVGSLKKFIGVALLSIAALAPWLQYVYRLGSASGTRPQLPEPSSVDLFNVYSQFLFGFQSNFVNTILLSSWPIVMLVALMAVRRSKGLTPQVSFIASMSLVPVVLAYIVSLVVTPFFLSRYMVLCVAPLLIMLVYLISRYGNKVGRGVAVALVSVMMLTSVLQVTSSATPVKEDYKSAVADINAVIKPQDIVVLSAPFTVYPFEYYYDGQAQVQTLPLWNRSQPGAIPAFNEGTLDADVASLNKNHRYVYLLLSQDQGYEDTISQYYLTHFKQISHTQYSSDLSLYVYQVGYYTVPNLEQSVTSLPE